MKRISIGPRAIAFAITLLAATGASAQSAYDPQVAYVQLSGNTSYIYLANQDGTHAVRLVAGVRGISGIDFAPGGGRIAFTDHQALKVVSYSASSSGIRVDRIDQRVTGVFGPPDFSPDGSRILYYQSGTATTPGGVLAVPSTTGAPVMLYASTTSGIAKWLRSTTLGNAFAFLRMVPHGLNAPVDYELWTVLLDAGDNVISAGPVLSTATQEFKAIEDFDIAHTRDALLVSADYPTGSPIANNIVELDLATGSITDKAGAGFRMHYSADDSRIVFRNLRTPGSSDYVNSLDLGTGLVTHLTKKGNFGTVDARP